MRVIIFTIIVSFFGIYNLLFETRDMGAEMTDKIKKGQTVTMFAPYDCNNACPFCINKTDYRDTSSFDLDRCFRSLDLLNKLLPHNDIVLTGGEPLANLEVLEEILSHIDNNHHIYINTTLPVAEGSSIKDLADFLNRFAGKIDCLNVSRHLKHYVKECDDSIFDLLKVRHRINCVVFEDADEPSTETKLAGFFERFSGHEIQLRANYSYLTPENVFDTDGDRLYKLINRMCKYQYDMEKELFRTGYVFKRGNSKVTYHKTLPYSKIDGRVGDIIIRQNGLIFDDWNTYGSELNINSFTLQ